LTGLRTPSLVCALRASLRLFKSAPGGFVRVASLNSAPGMTMNCKSERLEFLINLLEINNKDISNIRYQLLHRTASALIAAERFCAPHALMLVHSISQ